MIRQIQYSITRRPAWQRFLIVTASLIFTAMLLWVGLLFVFGFAFLALLVAGVNWIKLKVTGRPLFKGPQHFHRYQSQFHKHSESKHKGSVIEGEVVSKDD